jgi:hypothetical protein
MALSDGKHARVGRDPTDWLLDPEISRFVRRSSGRVRVDRGAGRRQPHGVVVENEDSVGRR